MQSENVMKLNVKDIITKVVLLFICPLTPKDSVSRKDIQHL